MRGWEIGGQPDLREEEFVRLDLGNAYEDREDNRQEDDDEWRNWQTNDWQF